MTFEEYWGEDPDPGKITAKHAWNAGQAAEREKYAELIAAAETGAGRKRVNDELTKAELLQVVVQQMETILFLQTQITEALQSIDNQAPDLAWRKLILAQERFQ